MLLRISTIIVSLLLSVSIYAQQGSYIEVQDFESWSSVGVKLKVNKKWEFGLNEQMRLKTNSTIVSNYFTELELNYIGWKRWELGAGLRFIKDNDTNGDVQGYENHMRFNMDLAYKHKVDRLKLSYRFRFQSKNELGISSDEGDYPNRHLRLKVGVGYNIKKWKLDPKLSTEIFRHYEKEDPNGFDKVRFSIGTEYKIKKLGALKLFYGIENELNVSYPKTTYIGGLSYVYTFKINKNEK